MRITDISKRIITFIAALSLGVILFAGYSLAAEPSESNTADDGKTLTIAHTAEFPSVDIRTGSGIGILAECAGVTQTLVAVDSDFVIHPQLATEWEQTAVDTWVFKLRDDVTFHDGTKFNADAVKWCLDSSHKKNAALPQMTKIQSISVIDEYTVEFKTSAPSGSLPEALSNVATAIIAPTSADANDDVAVAYGTGYYKQDFFDVVSARIECSVYDGYWGDKPDTNITKRVVVSLPDASTRSLSVQNGEVDVATDIPFSDLEPLSSREGVKAVTFNTARVYFMNFNLEKEYLKDSNVRKALIYAINQEEIVKEALLTVGGVPEGIFPEAMPWANTDVANYSFDIDMAKKLLADAGYADSDNDGYLDKNGEKLRISMMTNPYRPGNPLILQAMQGYYANIGIEATVNVLEINAQNERMANGDFDINLTSGSTAYVPSPSYHLDAYYHSSSTNAQGISYINPELDSLIEQCRAESDMEKKYELSKQAQAIAQEDAAIYTVALYGAVFAYNDGLQNFTYNAAAHDFVVANDVKLP